MSLRRLCRACKAPTANLAGACSRCLADPNVLRLLPPFILDESHVRLLQAALKQVG